MVVLFSVGEEGKGVDRELLATSLLKLESCSVSFPLNGNSFSGVLSESVNTDEPL